MVQFDDIQPKEHLWPMVRSEDEVAEAIASIEKNPGFVLYAVVNDDILNTLEDACRKLQVPCVPILDPVVAALSIHLNAEVSAKHGRQHVMDEEYFSRIEAMHFSLKPR